MALGIFGKYPGKRDFVAFGLPPTVLGPIENWLQSALAASQNKMGGSWQDYYLVMPMWRFRIGRDITGTDCLGVMMPSVDGVGRYFPLVIIAMAENNATFPVFETTDQKEWFSSIEQRLFSTLDENESPEASALCAGLDNPPLAPEHETTDVFETLNKGFSVQLQPSLEAGELDKAAYERILAAEAAITSRSRSSWWTHGGAHVPPQFLSSTGLPDPYHFVRMMGGA